MVVCLKPVLWESHSPLIWKGKAKGPALLVLMVVSLACVLPSSAQGQSSDWQAQVRKYAEAKDWDSAMRLVEQEIARAPEDMDVRAWRARVLAWSGRLSGAEK